MITTLRHLRTLNIALLAAGTLAACAQLPSSQQPVQASNPSVTYGYRTDQELLRASQNATTYCGQYQTAPRAATITNNADGSKTAVFECVRTAALTPPVNPNLSYTYRTDQELVQASQTASAYCLGNGSQPMTSSSMMANSDGTRTVTFQCGSR
ncbi:MAG TPA: hypothetical protein VNU02_19120 [Candidatus Dormibacteraeota bacterium]|nr:hypothetical protein [Candidatus Dormibacteraeota bacterium]